MEKTMTLSSTRDRFRPHVHFTAARNWINDPNGLVWFDGEWHLFYQYNPYGEQWGHMSWGHAVSRDLLTWEELPVAIAECDEYMIFSGSCVVDWANTSGLGDGSIPPLIALYTSHAQAGDGQAQCLASSRDRGRTWQKHDDNPVLDIGLADFRDPKVFWHTQSRQWIMAVARAAERRISFYGATDLKSWHHLSDFGPAGPDGKLWECPDLFLLEGEPRTASRWVLKVDLLERTDSPVAVAQIFFGEFDGTRFLCDVDAHGDALWQTADHGRDFYAAMSWSDVPRSDGRRIWLAWMNSHQYARLTPTGSWRGAMSIPRELSLRQFPDRIRLIQSPVCELADLREECTTIRKEPNGRAILALDDGAHELSCDFDATEQSNLAIVITWSTGASLQLGYDAQRAEFYVDRSSSGALTDHPAFAGRVFARRIATTLAASMRVFLDTCLLEVFCDDGEVVFSEQIFPPAGTATLTLSGRAGCDFRHWTLSTTA